MGLQKYRADREGQPCANGAVPWYVQWMGGPSLSLVRQCPTPWGPRTVYVRGEADTYFSIPAACEIRVDGKRHTVTGYLTCEGGNYEFRAHKQFHYLMGQPCPECSKYDPGLTDGFLAGKPCTRCKGTRRV